MLEKEDLNQLSKEQLIYLLERYERKHFILRQVLKSCSSDISLLVVRRFLNELYIPHQNIYDIQIWISKQMEAEVNGD